MHMSIPDCMRGRESVSPGARCVATLCNLAGVVNSDGRMNTREAINSVATRRAVDLHVQS